MKKRTLRWRIAELEADIERRESIPPTFRTLTVCFSSGTVNFDGRTIKPESDCLAIPILSTDVPYVPRNFEALR